MEHEYFHIFALNDHITALSVTVTSYILLKSCKVVTVSPGQERKTNDY